MWTRERRRLFASMRKYEKKLLQICQDPVEGDREGKIVAAWEEECPDGTPPVMDVTPEAIRFHTQWLKETRESALEAEFKDPVGRFGETAARLAEAKAKLEECEREKKDLWKEYKQISADLKEAEKELYKAKAPITAKYKAKAKARQAAKSKP